MTLPLISAVMAQAILCLGSLLAAEWWLESTPVRVIERGGSLLIALLLLFQLGHVHTPWESLVVLILFLPAQCLISASLRTFLQMFWGLEEDTPALGPDHLLLSLGMGILVAIAWWIPERLAPINRIQDVRYYLCALILGGLLTQFLRFWILWQWTEDGIAELFRSLISLILLGSIQHTLSNLDIDPLHTLLLTWCGAFTLIGIGLLGDRLGVHQLGLGDDDQESFRWVPKLTGSCLLLSLLLWIA
ncbi:MAG: hypothetical protein QF752_15515 [Planctomycetota bacterium]|jgi:hypothetical protein|nr:hypothetical protein [Planctomycetota bacterium]